MIVTKGSGGDDIITGTAGADFIKGLAGDDTIAGEGGNDRIQAGRGNDQVTGGDGNDTLTGGRGDDVIYGQAGDDTLKGQGGNDFLDGGSGHNVVKGGGGADHLIGGEGVDKLDGGRGDDTAEGGAGNDRLIGRGGHDELAGGDGDDILDGGPHDDVLVGDAGHDVLSGGTGHDELLGGDGDDTFDGGPGDDVITGGAGYDTGVYHGNFADYAISHEGPVTVIADHPPQPPPLPAECQTQPPPDPLPPACVPQKQRRSDGVDRVSEMEMLVFADRRTNGDATNSFPVTDPDGVLAARGSLKVAAGAPAVELGVPAPFDADGDALTVTVTEVPAPAIGKVVKIDGSTVAVDDTLVVGDLIRLSFQSEFGATPAQANFSYAVDDGRGGTAAQDVGLEVVVPPPGVIELSGLVGVNGFAIEGVGRDDESGVAVDGAGDVNGDGYDDVIIGARSADPNGDQSGEAYVILGKADGFSASMSVSAINGANGFVVRGAAAGDRAGVAVSGAGDVDGDGVADLLVGARGAQPNGPLSGAGYVVFGSEAGLPLVVQLSGLDGANGLALEGAAQEDFAGRSIRDAGDVNCDGLSDVIVGAAGADAILEPGGTTNVDLAGRSYVVFGKAQGFPAGLNLESLGAEDGVVIAGARRGDQSGFAVDGAGDVNGDGCADLIVGAYLDDPHGSASGASYLVFGGRDLGAASPVNLADIGSPEGVAGLAITGVSGGDESGRAVAGAGDVNGDGFADILIGAPEAGPVVDGMGESYLIFGDPGLGLFPSLPLDSLSGVRGFAIRGVDEGDHSGFAVSAAGDVNGDGYDDMLVSARDADPNGDGSGETYLLYGDSSVGSTGRIELFGLHYSQGLVLNGVAAGDGAGVSIGDAGDVNGDGYDDVVIGALAADPGGTRDAGVSYVVFGRDLLGRVTDQGGSGDDVLTGSGQSGAADVMVGGLGDDVLIGGRGPDVLRGGGGNDVLAVAEGGFLLVDGGAGLDTLRVDEAGGTLDLTTVPMPRIRDVEALELNGTGAGVTLDASAVLRMSSTANAVFVSGAASATVTVVDPGWTAAGSEQVGEETFDRYDNGQATLLVAQALGRTFVAGLAGGEASAVHLATTQSRPPVNAAHVFYLPSPRSILLPLALMIAMGVRALRPKRDPFAPRRANPAAR